MQCFETLVLLNKCILEPRSLEGTVGIQLPGGRGLSHAHHGAEGRELLLWPYDELLEHQLVVCQ